MPPYQFLADAVLLLHFGVVVFIVAGLPLIVVGNHRHWRWVNHFGFRLAHLAAIGIVAVQAWLGEACPLTLLENWLRAKGGSAVYASSFIEHWVQRVLFYDLPAWVFVLGYTLFGLLVAAAWWRLPPRHAAQ